MSRLKRVLGAQDGWGGAAGTLLLLVVGLVFLVQGLLGLNDAARLAPVERACAELSAEAHPPRWVRVTKCSLDTTAGRAQLAPGLWLKPAAAVAPSGTDFTGMLVTEHGELVLHEGRVPERGKTLLSLFIGLVAIALTARTLFMRWLVERDASL